MSWSNPSSPNLADYTLFVTNTMGISPLYLPTDSPFIAYAFDQAIALVISGGPGYVLAVYNCAGHIQIRITPDQTSRSFFIEQRKKFNVLDASFGVPTSAGDSGTSASLATPDALRNLTLGDLNFMKTPWGREYLAYAQDFGGIWGIS